MGYDLEDILHNLNTYQNEILKCLEKIQVMNEKMDELEEHKEPSNYKIKMHENTRILYTWKEIYKLCPVSTLKLIGKIILISYTSFALVYLAGLAFSTSLNLPFSNIFFIITFLFVCIIYSFNIETFSILKEGLEYWLYVYTLFLVSKSKKVLNREKILSYFSSFYDKKNKHFFIITNGIMGCNKEEIYKKDALLLLSNDNTYCEFDFTNKNLSVNIYPDGYIDEYN